MHFIFMMNSRQQRKDRPKDERQTERLMVQTKDRGNLPAVLLGCDHGGLELKNHLKAYLERRGHLVKDFGTHTKDAVDYPDVAYLVAVTVAEARTAGLNVFGVVIDGVGVASSMVFIRSPMYTPP